jgi:tyrosyl-tRNA synthetase
MDNSKLIIELKDRRLVEHTSAPLEKILSEKRTVYLGVDPSSDSMQAGNLVVVLLMKRLADAGHNIMLLVGGGTGMIGDPRESGERSLSDVKVIAKNKKAIRAQMQKIIGKKVTVVDNADWLLKIKLVDFLRDIGKHFTVNELTKRDIIKRRLETPNESISYTEFAYSLLQGYDFLTLFQKYRCDLQIGATDQWTNILSGVELIRRKLGKEAFALTCPLVTDASGKKFGKSEGNAIWLDAKKTSPFDFYQFWINQPDEKVEQYLKMYTFLSLDEIGALMELHKRNPAVRQAQKTLAREVTMLVHGKPSTEEVERKTQIQFGGVKLGQLSAEDLSAFKTITLNPQIQSSILSATSEGFAISKSEARRLMEGGGIKINDEVVKTDRPITDFDFKGQVVMIQKGKTAKIIIKK